MCTREGRSSQLGIRFLPTCLDKTSDSLSRPPGADLPTPWHESQFSLLFPLQFSVGSTEIVGLEFCGAPEVLCLGLSGRDSADGAPQKRIAAQNPPVCAGSDQALVSNRAAAYETRLPMQNRIQKLVRPLNSPR